MFESLRKLTNAQVYKKAFDEILMLPDPSCPGTYLGNSQREQFTPFLKRMLSRYECPRILDVGGGAGSIVDIALTDSKGAIVSFEEPNPHLSTKYLEKLARHPHLEKGEVYDGFAQDFYKKPEGIAWLKALPPQDVILMTHMIYYLTSFTDEPCSPASDLNAILQPFFDKLAEGGSLFIVYADQTKSYGGKTTLQYFQKRDPRLAENLVKIWKTRNEWFKDGDVAGMFKCEWRAIETPSKLFARSMEELAMICMTSEVGTSNDEPFDLAKITELYEFIDANRGELGVETMLADGPRRGMLSVPQPQVVCEIRKMTAS